MMRDSNQNANARAMCVVVVAIVLGLAVLAGYTVNAAAQNTETSQTQPEKKLEAGVGVVSDNSFKFGEYNGLKSEGALGISAFDFRGGASYDSGSAFRWRLQGANLGLETRNVFAELGTQGKFRINFFYDELLANRSDTNQTFYLGAGSTNLTLPANWVAPRVPQSANPGNLNFRSLSLTAGTGSVYSSTGVLTAPTLAQLTTLGTIRANDVPDIYNVDLATKRIKMGAGFSYSPNEHWDFPLSFTHEHKSGRKALGAVSSQSSGDEVVFLPDRIDYDTQEANAAVTYKFKKLFVTAAYYGSIFNNNVLSMTWQDPNNAAMSATMASMPSNQFHQFSITGAYKISDQVKVVVNGSYGRNTQDDAFLGPATAANGQLAWSVPAGSLNGLVVTSNVNAKVTAKPTKKWHLSAAYKYDNRDNQTPINRYLFQDANESKGGTPSPFNGLGGLPTNLATNTNIYNNRAYSKQVNQANAQSEYTVAKRQYLTAGYDWQKIDRSCTGAWINCADAPETNEHTIRGEWRANSLSNISARVGYAYSWRRGNYDEDAFLALVPMADVVPAGATMSAYDYLKANGLTGFGPVAGAPTTPLTGDAALFLSTSSSTNSYLQNGYYGSRNQVNEVLGMRRYYVADRNRHKVRSQVDWQATQKISVTGTGDFNTDDYLHSTYGLKKGTIWEATADVSYAANANFVVDLFYTYDDQRFSTAGDAYGNNDVRATSAYVGRAGNTLVAGSCYTTVASRNANAKIDPCLNWFKDSRDKIDTVGFSLRRKNLVSGKLELANEVMFTRGRTVSSAFGGSYVNNPLALAGAPVLAAGTPATYLVSATNYPVLRNDEIMVRPSLTWAFSKAALFRASYMFQRLMPSDWSYLGLQYGTGAAYLPTQEQPPAYAVHAAGISMVYTF